MKRKLKKYDEGSDVNNIASQVAKALQEGAPIEQVIQQLMQQVQDPNQVAQILMQAGVPQEQVVQIMQQLGGADQQQPQLAFGGEDPVDGTSSGKSDNFKKGFTLFPGRYGTENWFDQSNPDPGSLVYNRDRKEARELARRLNERIREDKLDDNAHEGNYGIYAKIPASALIVKNAKAVPTFAFGGPTNLDELLAEGGDALENAIRRNVKSDFRTTDTESYVKDLQGAFIKEVSQNNMLATLRNNLEDAHSVVQGLPKASDGIDVMSKEEYMAQQNAAGFDKTTAGEQWDLYHSSRTVFGNSGTGAQTASNNYVQGFHPNQGFGPGIELNPFAQIISALSGANYNVRGHGSAKGLESDFLKSGMAGTSDGRNWHVTSVENRGLFGNKKRFNISWDDITNGAVDPNGNPIPAPVAVDTQNSNTSDKRTANQFLIDAISRVSPKLASRMVPSFSSPSGNNLPEGFISPDELNFYKNAGKTPAAADPMNVVNNDGFTGIDNKNPLYSFANGGHFTVKEKVDYAQLADGLYGAGNKLTAWINSFNTGVDPANKFANFAIENIQGTGLPMDDGLYDQFGRFKPNDLGAQVLAGTGDKNAEFASRDNNFFGSSTRVMSEGGDFISDDDAVRLNELLKKAGMTLIKR